MSQNTQQLLLFFDSEKQHKLCLLILLKLNNDEHADAQQRENQLGVNFSQEWSNHWFNQKLQANPNFIKLTYDTSTSYNLPLKLLQQLFKVGLTTCLIETFNDQVGEFSYHYFHHGQQISHTELFETYPHIKNIAQQETSIAENEENVKPVKRASISKLIESEENNQKYATEMVDTLMELSRISRQTGAKASDVIRSILVWRALIRGIVHALLFTLITVLLFKGLWLWITLGIILFFALPVIYVMIDTKDTNDSDNTQKE